MLLIALAFVSPGCGGGSTVGGEVHQRTQEVRERLRAARERTERTGERLVQRVRRALEQIRRSVPQATRDAQAPSSRGRTAAGKVDAYLTDVLTSVDSYWTRTLTAADLPQPRVHYLWLPPGRAARTGCGMPADDRAAFYCPTDDTIYVAEQL